ncbi:MAG: hypothetical protein K6T34_07195 [Thermoflavifilum sp.]|nr:hypothetical protein [Thermoflavifilum sp.]
MEENLYSFFEQTRKLLLRYLRTRVSLLRTQLLIRVVKAIGLLLMLLLIFFIAVLVIIFLGMALGFWLGHMLGNMALGFLIVAVSWFCILVVAYLFRRRLFFDPIANLIVRTFFEDEA